MKLDELITWKVEAEGRPDEEEAVLINTEDGDVGEGYLEETQWYWANGFKAVGVRYWATMPCGLMTGVVSKPEALAAA